MHIFNKRWFAACAGAVVLALGSGCALPGPPLPPSLKLPAVVTDLSASRTGDAVTLRWTTPEDTTDKLPIKGPIVAEICRETLAATPTAAVGVKVAVTAPCAPVVGHVSVVPGESEMVDVDVYKRQNHCIHNEVLMRSHGSTVLRREVPIDLFAWGAYRGTASNLLALSRKRCRQEDSGSCSLNKTAASPNLTSVSRIGGRVNGCWSGVPIRDMANLTYQE